MPWYVLYTKTRNEKKVADSLVKMGITTYCPLVTTVKQWSDRKKKIQQPLFSSYVFVNLSEHERDVVFQVAGVVRYLFWLGKPAVIRDEEIHTLQKWLDSNYQKVAIQSIQSGDTIILKEGVFKGQSGIVKELRGNKIQLLLETLGFIITLERGKEKT